MASCSASPVSILCCLKPTGLNPCYLRCTCIGAYMLSEDGKHISDPVLLFLSDSWTAFSRAWACSSEISQGFLISPLLWVLCFRIPSQVSRFSSNKPELRLLPPWASKTAVCHSRFEGVRTLSAKKSQTHYQLLRKFSYGFCLNLFSFRFFKSYLYFVYFFCY